MRVSTSPDLRPKVWFKPKTHNMDVLWLNIHLLQKCIWDVGNEGTTSICAPYQELCSGFHSCL